MVIIVLSAVYLALAIGQLIRRRHTMQLIRDGLFAPFSALKRTPSSR